MSRELRIQSVSIGGENPPRILGVMNISPESFFSDSFTPCNQVLRRAEELRRAGADILDVGARSTAFNAAPLSVSEERERVCSALADLRDCGLPLSLDTCRSEVLSAALRYDIDLVNDIGGLAEPEFAKAVADSGLPVIAMASVCEHGYPRYFAETQSAIASMLERAAAYGIEDIILDPGIGKWSEERNADADWEVCRRFAELKTYDLPLLAAVSRKSFIGECVNKPPQERLYGTLAVLYHLLNQGADLLRVHDVSATNDFVKVFEQLRRG